MTKTMMMIVVFAVTPLTTSGRTTYVVGIPGHMDEATGLVVLEGLLDMVLQAPSGDHIQVVDAHSLQRVADLVIPNVRSPKARAVRLKHDLARVRAHMTQTTVRSGRQNLIRLPQFLEIAARGLRSNAGTTRIVVFGAPYYHGDPTFTFDKGLYPGDGHIQAPPHVSVFGTAGKETLLDGVVVDFCYLTAFTSGTERRAIRRFWTLYVHHLGGVLASCGASAVDAIESALHANTAPAVEAAIDVHDRDIVMRRAEAPAAIVAPPRTSAHAGPAVRLPNTDVIFLIDGSTSMTGGQDAVVDLVETIAQYAQEHDHVRVGIMVYCETVTNTLALNPIADHTVNSATVAFVKTLVLRNVGVNPYAAFSQATHALHDPARRSIIVAVGDMGPYELPQSQSTRNDYAIRVEGEVADLVSEWAQQAPGRRHVICMYAMDGNTAKRAETQAFMRLVADAGNGHYTESADEVVAALVDIASRN